MIEISIIIPVYNTEKYLKECLDSVYELNLDNKEIILINDCSTDDSLKILDEYKEKYKKNTIIVNHKVNQGLSAARNSGIEIAKGKYLFFLDSDDFIDSVELDKFFNEALKTNVEILVGNYYLYYQKNNIKKFRYSSKIPKIEISGLNFIEQSFKNNCMAVVSWKNLYRKDFLIKNNLFFIDGLLHEDIAFTSITLCLAKRIKYSDKYFYYYRQNREGSIMKKLSFKNYLHLLYITNYLLNFIEKEEYQNKYFNRIVVGTYYKAVKGKIYNKDIFNRIIKLKLNLREKIKIIIIYIFSLFNKEVLNENIIK